jgi:hypothetical protein
MIYVVIDERADTTAFCGDVCTALEVMRERGHSARVEDETGALLATLPPANTWMPFDITEALRYGKHHEAQA